MTANDLKPLPIFDNDFVTAMGSFLDSDVAGYRRQQPARRRR